jgi:hypothetical protein
VILRLSSNLVRGARWKLWSDILEKLSERQTLAAARGDRLDRQGCPRISPLTSWKHATLIRQLNRVSHCTDGGVWPCHCTDTAKTRKTSDAGFEGNLTPHETSQDRCKLQALRNCNTRHPKPYENWTIEGTIFNDFATVKRSFLSSETLM